MDFGTHEIILIIALALEAVTLLAFAFMAFGRLRVRIDHIEEGHKNLQSEFNRHDKESDEVRQDIVEIKTDMKHVLRHLNLNGGRK